MASIIDPSGNTSTFDYDTTKGVLDSSTDAKSNTTSYSYDGIDRMTDVYSLVGLDEVRNTYAYDDDRLADITHNGFDYDFHYDGLIMTAVSAKCT